MLLLYRGKNHSLQVTGASCLSQRIGHLFTSCHLLVLSYSVADDEPRKMLVPPIRAGGESFLTPVAKEMIPVAAPTVSMMRCHAATETYRRILKKYHHLTK